MKASASQSIENTAKEPEQASKPGAASVAVLVVDKNEKPLMPCSPRRARVMRKIGRAVVVCDNPFTIQLLDREGGDTQPVEIKLDPGSKTTGGVLTVEGELRGWFCVGAFEMEHRGQKIVDALIARSQLRRGRRARNTRYRKARFLNRRRSDDWLPPSIQSRVDNLRHIAQKYMRLAPISSIAIEQVRFDTQLMANPEISGLEYQQGELAGYEVREYLLEKFDRQCAYCQAKGIPLQIEHMIPRSRGGSDRISNLCLACGTCNQKKNTQTIQEFLKGKPELLARLLRQAKTPLKDAAAMNITRLAIVKALETLGVSVITSTGGRTKYNRIKQGYAKAHWIDAACVGVSGRYVDLSSVTQVTKIQAKGRGSRQMCKSDKFGFPRSGAKTVKRIHGFQTGDRVRLIQPSGKYKGTHEGEVSIRATGMFDIKIGKIKITAPHSRFTRLSRFDGYHYERKTYLALFARPGLGGNPSAATVAMVIYRNFDTFPLQAPSLLGL
jgi:5-methylcytosine-specific restriction endonuclease McrA